MNFVGSIERQYDDSFAKSGAKIGDSLKIRLPNQYTVRSGASLSAQTTVETSTTLQVSTQKGVDVSFTSVELALSLDDFSKRILDPAMSVLAAAIESDAMSMYKDVSNSVWATGATTLAHIASGRTALQRSLTPSNDRHANLNPQAMQDLVTAGQTFFNPTAEIAKQYKEGFVGRQGGFDYHENTLWANHTRGSAADWVCNTSTGITSGTATLTFSGGSGTFAAGDVITIAGVYSVHPESKASTGVLQQFVVTNAGSSTAPVVSPTPVTSGASQNVTIVSAGASKAVTQFGTASTAVGTSLLYQKEAFAFATADLPVPKGVDFAAREVFDGISMRIVQDYSITDDTFPCRIDVLYGYKTLRPQLATRVHTNNVA